MVEGKNNLNIEKTGVCIGLEQFIETYKKFPVLASSDYMLNELARSRDDVLIVNPNSSIGKFFGDSIPDVKSLFPNCDNGFATNLLDYGELKNVFNQKKQHGITNDSNANTNFLDNEKEFENTNNMMDSQNSSSTTTPLFPGNNSNQANILNSYNRISSYNPEASWYNASTKRPFLENILANNNYNNSKFMQKPYYQRQRVPNNFRYN